MSQTALPFHFMRGGTSRGPYMLRSDLPSDPDELARVLIAIVGSGHPLNIDGIGGGAAVTTKVAMLSKSDDNWADIDYFFAQVSVEDRTVDFKPTCGNILVGVGPAALEMGLIKPNGPVTEVKIRAVNTGARVAAQVRTDEQSVIYDGTAQIDGVPGTSAPIDLMFMDVTGGATGSMFPTGRRIDVIDGIEVSCVDVAMPMAIARAEDFGLTGQETATELDENRAFYERMEPIRIEAGRLMGMGDVSGSVTPKFGVLAPPVAGGHALTRYFMPKNCHPSLAVTGSQCLSACLLCPGTIADGILSAPPTGPLDLKLEHPMGLLDVRMDYTRGPDNTFEVKSAGLTRTARLLARGEVMIPRTVWAGP
ncbi:4-oxalomesaconate tautomerase [Thalassococcus lentus]|uniref:4-oxalomesaconate tautomerase n=1 Tax=Thalassococcus lentus TaxID=1210524 RepID=A0ABT4XNW0_9RHOB|nr:4-oxalomesaconate tautomerase [Thalassococcus lentus]MDA7423633.1 4-oxalomesaconate tautomerase [Thalassococcus lentus]